MSEEIEVRVAYPGLVEAIREHVREHIKHHYLKAVMNSPGYRAFIRGHHRAVHDAFVKGYKRVDIGHIELMV